VKLVVSVADMKCSTDASDVIITHGLGTCLGLSIHDPGTRVGGLLHVMMPASGINPVKAQANPYMFVDTGVPAFLERMKSAGARPDRWIVKVAGGASTTHDHFSIGKRNWVTLRKTLWRSGILIDKQDVGGSKARTMSLAVDSGQVTLSSGGTKWTL
jgi:chemotaxis protein CheD